MRKSIVLAAVLGLAFSAGLFAQAFSIDYLDGTVELRIPKDKSGKEWKALAIGSSVALDASLRVGASSSVELSRGGTRITILKPGIYSVADLSKAREKAVPTSIASALSQRAVKMAKGRGAVGGVRADSAVGGVRQDKVGDDGVTWMDTDDEVRSKVAEYMADRKFRDAVSLLTKEIPVAATGEEANELTYLLAAAYYGGGESLRAFRTVSKLPSDPVAAYYPRDLLLKAQILVDSLDYGEALALLKPIIGAGLEAEDMQMAYLLAGVSQKGLGDEASAKGSFNAGYAIDPSTETAKLISEQLGK